MREVFAGNCFDGVFHLAPRAAVRPSLAQPQLYTQINIVGTQNLLELAREFAVQKFVFASSSGVYGPRQRPNLAIHKFTRAMATGKPIEMHGDGSTAPDYTYIDNILQGVLVCLDKDFGFEVINLGESRTVKLLELMRLIEKALGKSTNVCQLPPQLGDVPITYADIAKARRLLDYRPQVPIEDGIARFVDWFRRHA